MADSKPEAGPVAAEPVEEVPASPPLPEMRSISLTGYGGIRMVKVVKAPELSPKEGEVTIRVKSWCVLSMSLIWARSTTTICYLCFWYLGLMLGRRLTHNARKYVYL